MYETIALIVAGGKGLRIERNCPKQYLKIKGKSVLQWILEKFISHPDIDAVAVVINKTHESLYLKSISSTLRNRLLPHIFGGPRRQDSVRLGLEALQKMQPKNVLIHDAARIFTPSKLISKLVVHLKTYKGAVLGTEVNDTLCHATAKKLSIVPRNKLFQLQTPQAFRYKLITKLHEEYKHEAFTDDISLLIRDGCSDIKIVASTMENFKITTAADLSFAKSILT